MNVPDVFMRWILCFRNETRGGAHDFMVCQNTNEMSVCNIFKDISEPTKTLLHEFKIEEYDMFNDPLRILNRDIAGYGTLTEQRDKRMSDKDDEQNSSESPKYKYMKLYVPVTKTLYAKIIGLSIHSMVRFTESEILDIVEHLLLFLDSKSLVLRLIFQQLVDDEDLHDRIKALYLRKYSATREKSVGTSTIFAQIYCNLIVEMLASVYFIITDESSNVAFASEMEEYETRLPVYVNLLGIGNLIVTRFLRISSYFLMNNHEYLLNSYDSYHNTSQENIKVVVEVDFSDLFRCTENFEGHSSSSPSEKIVNVLKCKFIGSYFVEKLIVRFSKVRCDFDMSFLGHGNVQMHFYRCIIQHGAVLPSKLVGIYFIDSLIKVPLVMPGALGVFVLKRTKIEVACAVCVGISCMLISIDQASGDIRVPFINRYLLAKSADNWSFELHRNADGPIDTLKISNYFFSGLNLHIKQAVRAFSLTNVIIKDTRMLVISSDTDEVILTDIIGFVRLFGIDPSTSVLFYFDKGSLRLVKSKKNVQSKELMISSASLLSAVIFSRFFSRIEIDDVAFYSGCRFESRGTDIAEIVIKNCLGEVKYDGLYGFNELSFTKPSLFSIQAVDRNTRVSSSNISGGADCYELILMNFLIKTSLKLPPSIKKVYCQFVEAINNSIVLIDSAFESVALINCFGRFGVPNISYGNESLVHLLRHNNHIEIVRTSAALYNITIIGMHIERAFDVKMDVDEARLGNVTIEEGFALTFGCKCNNLIVKYFKGQLNFPHVTRFNRVVAQDSDLTGNYGLLSIPTKHFEGSNVVLDHDMSFGSCTRMLHLNRISNEKKRVTPVYASKNLELFVSGGNDFSVDITNFVRNVTTKKPLLTTRANGLHVDSRTVQGCDKIVLENFHVCGIWEIVRNAAILKVKFISSYTGSILRVNADTKSLYVERSKVRIDVSNVRKLKALTLVQTQFFYNTRAFQSLCYLRFSGMVIEVGITLREDLKVLILTDVRIKGGLVLKVSPTITDLLIDSLHGTVDMSGIIGPDPITLHGTELIKLRRIPAVQDEYSLVLRNCTFEGDITLDGGFKTVRMIGATINRGFRLTLDRKCERLELNSCNIDFDCSRADRLGHITLRKMPLRVLEKVFSLTSVSVVALEEFKFENEVKCPDHIRAIILYDTEMADKTVFYVDENCEEVSLFHCIGTFDLSRATRLRKLAVVPPINSSCSLQITYPSLNAVTDLELVCDSNDRHFLYLLSNCINAERCTLHCPKHSVTNTGKILRIIPCKKLFDTAFDNPWFDSLLFDRDTRENCNTVVNQVKMVNAVMNRIFYESFTFGMQSRMKYLKLEGFNLDERSVTALRNFHSLQTLVLSNSSIRQDFFFNLPPRLETLKLGCGIDLETEITWEEPHPFAYLKGLEEHKHLKNLVLDKYVPDMGDIFSYLPASLESFKLTLGTFNLVRKPDKDLKKIRLKCFAVKLYNGLNIVWFTKDPVEQCAAHVFTYFADFIEFKALDELILELNGETMILDTETYLIK